jgi:hypothetical protein
MTKHWAKTRAGGEGPETNAFAIEYFESLVAGGEGPEINMFGSEYIDSFSGPVEGPGDYGIWTSLPEPSRVEVRRKKAA